jgi:thiamine pyrophosphokinase
MNRVLVVGNGKKNRDEFLRFLSSSVNFIIGVDGGAETLVDEGIKVDLAIGDFDSISSKKLLTGIKTIEYPKDKNYSDTELAMNYAFQLKPSEIILTNMLGGRTDHFLFNISLLVNCIKSGINCHIAEENEEIYATKDKIKIKVDAGDVVSLVPMIPEVTGVTTSGLKYTLSNKTIYYGSTLPLSNIAISDEINVSVKSGMLLVVINKIR